MPAKKAKPEKNESQAPDKSSKPSAAETRPEEQDVRRLLRIAAWSRMFGRTGGGKNPFTR